MVLKILNFVFYCFNLMQFAASEPEPQYQQGQYVYQQSVAGIPAYPVSLPRTPPLNSLYQQPATAPVNSGYPGSATAVNSGYQSPSPVNSGYQPPRPAPVNSIYQPPAMALPGYQPHQSSNSVYQPPSPANSGYQSPLNSVYQPRPSANSGYQSPLNSVYQPPPPANLGYQSPLNSAFLPRQPGSVNSGQPAQQQLPLSSIINPRYPQSRMPCALPYRNQNPAACVTFMRKAAEDPDLFWFGNQMNQICFDQPLGTENVTCNNARPQGYDQTSFLTMGSRIFLDNQFSASIQLQELRYPLTVTYSSGRDVFSGCNSSAYNAQDFQVDVNPNMLPLPAFHFRSKPKVIPPRGCDQENLCTVFFMDASYSIVHNVWVNWPREDPPDLPYLPTAPVSQEPTPFAWLVFKQNDGPIVYEPTPDVLEKGYPFYGFEIQNFMTQFGLKGPIAMTWLLAVTDISAVSLLDSIGAPGTPICPAILEQSLRKAPNTLYPDVGIEAFKVPQPQEKKELFTVWLNVKYASMTISTNQFVSSNNLLWLDPIKNGMINAEDTENQPQVFVTPRGFPPNAQQLQGRNYALFMVRKDLLSPPSQNLFQTPYQKYTESIADEQMVLLHWFIGNLQGNAIRIGYSDPVNGDVSKLGEEFIPYLGVTSPGSPNIYFLLYEQPNRLSQNEVGRVFSLRCGSEELKYRCQFPLQKFVRDNQLNLVGLSRFRAHFGMSYGYSTG